MTKCQANRRISGWIPEIIWEFVGQNLKKKSEPINIQLDYNSIIHSLEERRETWGFSGVQRDFAYENTGWKSKKFRNNDPEAIRRLDNNSHDLLHVLKEDLSFYQVFYL